MLFPVPQDADISSDRHALIVPPFMGHGSRVHPVPFTEPSIPCKSMIMSLHCYLFSMGLVICN